MVTYGQQGNEGGQDGRGEKRHGPDPVGITLQPFADGEIGRRPGKDVGRENPLRKLPGEQDDDARNRRPQDFPDADLLGSLLGHERGQAKKTQARDDDGKEGEISEDRAGPFLGPIERIQGFVEELEPEFAVRGEFLPDGPDVIERPPDVLAAELDEP